MTHSARRYLTLTAVAAAALIAVSMLVLYVVAPAQAGPNPLGQPLPDRLLQRLERLSHERLGYAGDSTQPALKAIAKAAPEPEGKPLVLYVGADFCPYCAALRWPLVIALMRFGQVTGLRYMRSSATDVYPDTITFDFHSLHYHSRYLQLQAVEVEDRDGHALQRLSAAQKALFSQFDTQPYTNYPGAIPFLYLGGRFVSVGSPVSPALLKGLSWPAAVAALASADGALTRQVLGAANQYTAALCRLTHDQPTQVCQAAGVLAAAKQLPQTQ